MTASPLTRSGFVRPWLIWTAGFLSFPIAGIAGAAVAGRVDSPTAALVGGLVTGAVIGAGQSLASSRRLDPRRWILASAARHGTRPAARAPSAVGFGTSLSDLAVMGALTGLVLGIAQALALPARASYRVDLGRRDPGAVGAGLDGHHRGRNRRRQAVHRIFGATAPSPSPPCPGCCCTGSCPSAPPATAARRLRARPGADPA